jgi:hypothetical protein
MIGYLLFGVAMTKTALPRWSGYSLLWRSGHLLGLGISVLVSAADGRSPFWSSMSLGHGLLSDVARTGRLGFACFR